MVAVSVVIPSYSRPESLILAVKSALAQTHAPLEVIVADDCSPFDVRATLAPFGERVRVLVNEKNSGASCSRNAGADAAKGEFIGFLDDDDQWKPNFIERHLAEIGSSKMSVCGSHWLPNGGVRVMDIDFINLDMLRRGNPYAGASAYFCRKELMERARFDEALRNGNDWDFMISAARIAPIRYIREALVDYQMPMGATSLTNEVRQLSPEQLQIRYAAAEKHRQFLGPYYYRLRLARLTLAYLGTRRDKMAFVHHALSKAGPLATGIALSEAVGRQLQARLRR